jgi:hypothetical protein
MYLYFRILQDPLPPYLPIWPDRLYLSCLLPDVQDTLNNALRDIEVLRNLSDRLVAIVAQSDDGATYIG